MRQRSIDPVGFLRDRHRCRRRYRSLMTTGIVLRVKLQNQLDRADAGELALELSLQQTHLPTLERADIIEFDDRTVELTDEASELKVYLDIVPSDSIPWSVYYLGLTVIGGIIMAGLWLEVIPTGTVPELGWATLVFALFAVSSAVYVVQNRRMRLGEMGKPP
ncbi:hypothetical protein [Haloterrigena sp. H1]|uniref:hypothetical protein n=1 Tax=Haloterrigena sp. H1 TaxID=2552943 RepID=UPI003742E6A6